MAPKTIGINEIVNIAIDDGVDTTHTLAYRPTGLISLWYIPDGSSTELQGVAFNSGTPEVIEELGFAESYDGGSNIRFYAMDDFDPVERKTITRIEYTGIMPTYGFSEDKSKVEVYSREDFAIITGTVQNVSAGNKATKEVSSAELAELGITKDDAWAVVSALQKVETGQVKARPWEFLPTIRWLDYPELKVWVENTTSVKAPITFRVVVMKIN